MQAFYTCFMKFCLALNSYKLNKNCWRETCINYMMVWKTM